MSSSGYSSSPRQNPNFASTHGGGAVGLQNPRSGEGIIFKGLKVGKGAVASLKVGPAVFWLGGLSPKRRRPA